LSAGLGRQLGLLLVQVVSSDLFEFRLGNRDPFKGWSQDQPFFSSVLEQRLAWPCEVASAQGSTLFRFPALISTIPASVSSQA